MVAARLGHTYAVSRVGTQSIEGDAPAIELRQPPVQGGYTKRKGGGWLSNLLGLGSGRGNRAGIGALAGLTMGFVLATAPTPALADYVKKGANNQYEIVRSDATAPVMAADVARENQQHIRALEAAGGLSERDLSQYPLFRKFWNELTNVGEFEISAAHVAKILEYASSHNLQGDRLPQIVVAGPDGAPTISAGNRALIKHLLQHPYYGAFFEQESRPLLAAAFGLPMENVVPVAANRPVDLGNIDLSTIPQWQGSNYTGNMVGGLHRDITSEFTLNRSWYEGGTKEESALRLTALLVHFGHLCPMGGLSHLPERF